MTDHLTNASQWIEKAFEARDEGGVNASLGMLLIAVREHNKHLRATTPNAAGRGATPEELAAQRESWARGEAEMSRLEREEGRHTSLVPLAPIRCAECRKPLVAVASDEPGVRYFAPCCQRYVMQPEAEGAEVDEEGLRHMYDLGRFEGDDTWDELTDAHQEIVRRMFEFARNEGRSSAARELSERDARIRELEEKVEAVNAWYEKRAKAAEQAHASTKLELERERELRERAEADIAELVASTATVARLVLDETNPDKAREMLQSLIPVAPMLFGAPPPAEPVAAEEPGAEELNPVLAREVGAAMYIEINAGTAEKLSMRACVELAYTAMSIIQGTGRKAKATT